MQFNLFQCATFSLWQHIVREYQSDATNDAIKQCCARQRKRWFQIKVRFFRDKPEKVIQCGCKTVCNTTGPKIGLWNWSFGEIGIGKLGKKWGTKLSKISQCNKLSYLNGNNSDRNIHGALATLQNVKKLHSNKHTNGTYASRLSFTSNDSNWTESNEM